MPGEPVLNISRNVQPMSITVVGQKCVTISEVNTTTCDTYASRLPQEHQRSQREQWEIRQLDHDLLQQRHCERERERELKELAEQKLILVDDQDELSLPTV